jgi:hypothetical protein
VKALRGVLAAVWDFVVGDDWRTALGVVGALALTAAIAASGVSAWWVTPLASVALLWWSLRRSVRTRAARGGR